MFEPIFQAVSDALGNQFLSGGLVLGLIGSLIALCRQLPAKIVAWLKRRVVVAVDVSNDDPIFEWLSLWLASHPYSKRARCLTAKSRRDNNGRIDTGSTDGLPDVVFTPAPGNHFFIYKHRLVWLSRDRQDVNGDKAENFFSRLHRETFQIRVLGRKQEIIRSLIENARKLAMEARDSRVEIFTTSFGAWYRASLREMRPLSTVVLPGKTVEEIADDVRQFRESEGWYRSRGIPYRRGYLFHGVPGSGKTSLISALAGQFQMALYVLNLADPSLTDSKVLTLLSETKAGSIILLEDIDASFAQREKGRDSDNGLTFSGLLNALDGAASQEGTLVFMTTNHKSVLDPALIRPGRADVHLLFDYATREQALSLFQQFFPDTASALANKFADSISPRVTMAQIQGHLLQHRNSAEGAAQLARLAAVA